MAQSPIIIIGAGPSGLMAAQKLAELGHQVDIYEQNKAAGRKFLVAGHGGFNLTHSEPTDQLIENYDRQLIREIVSSFDNQEVINWLKDIGIETYIGSSGKIFPVKGIKPIQVLQSWLSHLQNIGVGIHYESKLIDFSNQEVTIETKNQLIQKSFKRLILAFGGGSWQKTGSDGRWIELFNRKKLSVVPLQAANSGFETTESFLSLEGKELKNIQVRHNDISKLGEIVFTKYGIEGAPIYFLNRFMRNIPMPQTIEIDLKPHKSTEEIVLALHSTNPVSKTLKEKLKLSNTALMLLKKLDKETYNDPERLAKHIKSYPIEVINWRPIDEVISTAGGVNLDTLHNDLSLIDYPAISCIGEMLDWEAPTGGYLLQACFSTGAWVAHHLHRQLIID